MKAIKLYVLHDEKQNKLIAEMEVCNDIGQWTFGAVSPKTDCNHYKQIFISGIKEESGAIMGLDKWWEWAVESDKILISEEFPFDPKDVNYPSLK